MSNCSYVNIIICLFIIYVNEKSCKFYDITGNEKSFGAYVILSASEESHSVLCIEL